MGTIIYPIQTGFTVNYLVRGESGVILIDGGAPNSLPHGKPFPADVIKGLMQ